MKIVNRDLLLIGIKLIGLWLLFHSVINLAQSAITGGAMYHAHQRAEARAPWQVPEGISEKLATELNEKWKMDNSMNKLTYKMQMMQAWSKIPWELLMVLIALYMCRSGGLIIRFLGAEEEKNPSNV